MGVQDERTDEPHVAGEHDRVGSDVGEEGGQRGVITVGHDGRADPLRRGPVDRRAGSVRDHEDDLGAELAALRGGMERPQVRARPRHRNDDPAAHSNGPSAYRAPSSCSTGTT